MSAAVEPRAKQALRKKPAERTAEDLNTIYSFLHGLDILSHFREHQLRIMSSSARYERYKGNQVLFCSETIARCWYILLSGSVLMKDSMFLPPCSEKMRSSELLCCQLLTWKHILAFFCHRSFLLGFLLRVCLLCPCSVCGCRRGAGDVCPAL